MTTRPQAAAEGEAALERDLEVLKTISRERDGFLGVGAVVPVSGVISIGDAVVLGG